MRRSGSVATLAVLTIALTAAGAAATTEAHVKPGTYAVEAGNRTTSNAISFVVHRNGQQRTIHNLVFRNHCLTNNEQPPPVIKIRSDGHFSHAWTSTNIDASSNSLSGRFIRPGVVTGVLKIEDTGCTSHYRFKAHRS